METTSKLDRLTDEVRVLSRAYERSEADKEKRIRSLEKWKFAIPASSLLVIAAFLGGKVG